MRAAGGTGVRARQASGAARAAAAYLLVGSLAGVNAAITAYPIFAAQALRYTLATLVLWTACAVQRRRHRLPRRTGRLTSGELALVAALATVGVAGFNYCAAEAVRHTGAATTGTVIGAVPVVLAIAGPLAARRRPAPRVIVAAILVTAGAAVVTGLDGTNLPGLLFACGALAAEACFTLLAVPLLPAFGPLRLSAYVTGCSVPVLFALGFATGGRGAVPVPTAGEALAIVYLAVAVGAGGFYFLYSALPRLGADGVGLFAGLVPFGAMGAALLLGAGTVRLADVGGALLVAAGVAAGTGRTTRRERGPDGPGNEEPTRREEYGGGAAAQPDADGGTACLAYIARTGAPRGAAPPHSVTISSLPKHVQVVTSETQGLFPPDKGRPAPKRPATGGIRGARGVGVRQREAGAA